MRFNDLFISYKIGLKNVGNNNQFTYWPLSRKVFMISSYTCASICSILFYFVQNSFLYILSGLSIIPLIVYSIIDFKRNNIIERLEKQYIPYSKKRMNMVIETLKKYNINIDDFNSIDMLIMEAELAQTKCDYLSQFKKSFKAFGAIIISIVSFTSNKIGTKATQTQLLDITGDAIIFILLLFTLYSFISYIVEILFCRDYIKYNELIYDLRQIKLFYSKN